MFAAPKGGGGGCTPLYGRYGDVPLDRVYNFGSELVLKRVWLHDCRREIELIQYSTILDWSCFAVL